MTLMSKPRPCPSCKAEKLGRHYLCESCWWTLPSQARGPLLRKDDLAVRRLAELLDQLKAGTALHKIVITIR